MGTPSSRGRFRLQSTNASSSTPHARETPPENTSTQSIFSVSGQRHKGCQPKTVNGEATIVPSRLIADDLLPHSSLPASPPPPPTASLTSSAILGVDMEMMAPDTSLGLVDGPNLDNDNAIIQDLSPSAPLPSSFFDAAPLTPAPPSQIRVDDTFPHAISTAGVCDKADKVLDTLRDVKLSPGQFFYTVMDRRNVRFEPHQNGFLPSRLAWVLCIISLIWWYWKTSFIEWMEPHARELVCQRVADEFEKDKDRIVMSVAGVTPEFLSTWSLCSMFGWKGTGNERQPVTGSEAMPWWYAILNAATKTDRSDDNNQRTGDLGRSSITAQAFHVRSYHSSMFQFMFSVFAWARCRVGCACLETRGTDRSWSTYDNINLSTTIHVEQHPGAPQKVQSGTFSIIYELYGVRIEPI
ncbi:hypothetical protein BDZ89DRAFT_1165704 [Hymenopellis radicata]|nr:hypothetical protein BDZ89DRAFT_1165704 [Hymenopellis radicata]